MTAKKKIAIGASGSGTTFLAIAQVIKSGSLDLERSFLFADRDCGALKKAKDLNIKVVQKRESETLPQFHQRVIKKLQNEAIDIVALAGYLRLFPVSADDRYLVLNSHPAAIPYFGGPGMWGIRVHETVLKFTRATKFRHPYTYSTIHIASPDYDNGDILGLKQMEIFKNDTPEKIAARLLPLEHQNYIEVLSRLQTGQAQAVENYDDLILASERKLLKDIKSEVLNKYS